jgi:hypothetical protein
MRKLARAAIAILGFRVLVVATRGERMIDRDQPSRPTPQRQVVIARWHSTADGRLEARWVPDPPAE